MSGRVVLKMQSLAVGSAILIQYNTAARTVITT